MKAVNGHEVIGLFEQFSPKAYAMEGDKIGLQIGTLNKSVDRVMIALDVLEEVVDEAIENKVQLIIAHHPPIFRPLKKLTTDNVAGRLIEKLLKHNIAVYAAHTNLDVTPGGVNDMLVEALGIENAEVLFPTYEKKLKKISVYVPESHADEVRIAMGKAGAGAIGDYSHCSFSSQGEGRFLPGDQTQPFIGSHGKLETVKEIKIETIVEEHLLKKTLSALLKAHPYEEVAYDIFSLDNKGEVLGLGRIGSISPMTLGEFAEKVKLAFGLDRVRVIGNLQDTVRKVAVLGGDGNKYYSSAKYKGADVYVTGDIYYHTAHDAMMEGLNIIDPGHNIEKIMKKGVAEVMKKMCDQKGFQVTFLPSEVDTNPFQII